MTDQFATIWAAIIGASFTAVVALLKGLIDERARKNVRQEGLADRRDERTRASAVAAAEATSREQERRDARATLEKERVQNRAERETSELYADGKVAAAELLRHLADLQSKWRSDLSASGAFSYEAEISARIRYYGLLIPDPDVRDIVEEGMDVIDHIWVADTVAEVDNAKTEQRRVCGALMRSVAAYIRLDSQDPKLVGELKATNLLISEAFETYEQARRNQVDS